MKHIFVLVGTSLLAACGGGGSSDNPAVDQPIAQTAALTAANQDVVAHDATTGSSLPVSSTQLLTGAEVLDERLLFNLTYQQIAKLPSYIADLKSNSTLVGVVKTQTVNCYQGGSFTMTGTVADNNGTASAGDSITLTSNGCMEHGVSLSGSMSFAITAVSGNFGSDSFSAGMIITFDNLTANHAQFSTKANGNLSLQLTASGANMLSGTASTPSLSVSDSFAGVTHAITLTNYNANLIRRPDPVYTYTTSFTTSGQMTSSSIASQTVQFSTPTPMVVRFNDIYPSSGVMLITGANNSRVRISALSNTQALQELDANGDGTYEASKTVNWNSLM